MAKAPARTRSARPQLPVPSDKEDVDLDGELLSGKRLLTPQVLQIAVTQGYGHESVEKLLQAELAYNDRRLEIIREHAEKHPDLVEERRTKRFRRGLYVFLAFMAAGLLGAMPFINIAVGSVFGVCGLMIIAGTLINARDRDSDVKAIVLTVKRVLDRKSRDQ